VSKQTREGSSRSFLDRLRAVPAGTWVGLAIAVVAVVFVVQNQGTTTVELLWMTFRSPLWLTLLVVFAVGWLVGALVRRNRAG
jgi:putative membrane protein